jgi:hypothetical protein
MHDEADALSTRTYVRAVTDLAARHDLGWAAYDYESAYAVRAADGHPTPLYDGLGLRPRTAPPPPPFSYERGVVIAHWLGDVAPRYLGQSRTPHGYAAPWFDGEDLRWIAEHGFDHVQISVDASQWSPERDRLPEAKLAPFARALQLANQAGLGVVLRYQPPRGAPPERTTREWGLLAARFAAHGDGLRFHAGEEPRPITAELGARFRAHVAAVRAADPRRFFYVPVPLGEPLAAARTLAGTEERNRAYLRHLQLDPRDARLGVSFEYWEPKVLTSLYRGGPQLPFPGRVPVVSTVAEPDGPYGSADEYRRLLDAAAHQELRVEDVVDDLALIAAAAAAEAPGRALYLSRFGMFEGVAPLPTRRYLSTITGAARALGIGWSVYDYESGRAIRDSDGRAAASYQGLGLVPRALAP